MFVHRSRSAINYDPLINSALDEIIAHILIVCNTSTMRIKYSDDFIVIQRTCFFRKEE